jgi:predicted nucleic acid-binding protein
VIIAVDTSVVVAALMGWHERHEIAARVLSRHLDADEIVLPQQVVLESYSVMTRLPSPHRIAPADAYAVLSESFREGVSIVSLSSRSIWPMLEELAQAAIAGGRTYDAAIARAARAAQAEAILTFNRRDFEALRSGLQILEPE